ncbi:MAG: hypothetical protein QM765_01095 [Myxococcales bacterium]
MRRILMLLVLSSVAGCVHYGPEFVPALGTQAVVGTKNTGITTVDGMTVAVNGQRWPGSPGELGAIVTPLEVTITNHSGQPVQLTHKMFALVGPTGVRVSALSPYQIQRPGSGSYGPGYGYGYGYGYGWGPWGGWYGPAWGYGGYWGPYYYSEPLPSRDMLQRAMPEGQLAEGGSAHGYVFFPYVGDQVGQVLFLADVISTESNEKVAEIQVPLVAKG